MSQQSTGYCALFAVLTVPLSAMVCLHLGPPLLLPTCPPPPPRLPPPLCPTGFVAGEERTSALAAMGPDAAVAKFLQQLDDIFGTEAQPRPASAVYVKSCVFDWSQEPYVGGAYSYPTLGVQDGDRDALAAPVAGTVFFAGKGQVCTCVYLVVAEREVQRGVCREGR